MTSLKCYEYPGILVIHIESAPSIHKFKMREGDISLGAYYYGKLTIIDAARQDIIGHTFTDWYDFTRPENHRFNEWDKWMVCKVEDSLGWRCFHSECGTYNGIELINVTSAVKIDGTPAVILDGEFCNEERTFNSMDYIEHPTYLKGTGRIVLFHKNPV